MESPFRKALIPVDASRWSMQAAEYGIRLAKSLGFSIVCLYVIDPDNAKLLSDFMGRTQEDVEDSFRREGENALAYLTESATKAGVECRTVVERGSPSRVILEVAEREGVDLIIIGKVGHRGPRRILIGPVTERVLENSPCPVLVVPQS